MDQTYEVLPLVGQEIEAHWPQLAELRIEVFYEFPYLYEGTLEYERDYLQTYWQCPDSLAVLIRRQGRVVGASTALPLAQETPEFRQPFEENGLNSQDFLYLGESVLLPAHRGHGLGHLFFDERERHARSLGLPRTCFCAVERPDDHPLRPESYRPLVEFWKKRGYLHHPRLRTTYSWKDRDQEHPTAKPMSFWLK